MSHVTTKGMPNLSPRELEIAELVAEGLSNQEIADRVRLHTNTVKNHISECFYKLGAESRTQVALIVFSARPCPHCGRAGAK